MIDLSCLSSGAREDQHLLPAHNWADSFWAARSNSKRISRVREQQPCLFGLKPRLVVRLLASYDCPHGLRMRSYATHLESGVVRDPWRG